MKSNVFLEHYLDSELIPKAMEILLSRFNSPESEIIFTSLYGSCDEVIDFAQKAENTFIFTGTIIGPWELPSIYGYERREDVEKYIYNHHYDIPYIPFVYINKEKRNVIISKKIFTKYGKPDFVSLTYRPLALTQAIPTLTPWLFPEYEQVKSFVINNLNYVKECNNL